MQEYRGNLKRTTPVRTAERLWEAKLLIGETNVNDSTTNNPIGSFHTTATLWVPRPTSVLHTAGVFLSLHNARGRVFTRLQGEDLLHLATLFSVASMDSAGPLNTAIIYEEAIKEAHRTVFESTQDRSQSDPPLNSRTQHDDPIQPDPHGPL